MGYLSYFIIPFTVSLIITPLVRRIAIKNGFVAYPRADRWHKYPTALLGGISIYFASVFSILYTGLINRNALGLFLGGTLLFVVGLLDDKFQFRPYIKLFAQIISGCIAISSGIILVLPINILLAIPLTLFCIIVITNSFNLLDNIDGLAAGIAAISSLMLFFSSMMFSNNQLGVYALVLSGAVLGFLPYNFNPAKIFMGDSGSMFIGYSLSLIAITGTSRHISNLLITLLIPVLILSVPIFDTLFVMFIRKLQGKSIFKGGKDHTSHHMVTLGLSQKKTVVLLYSISISFGLMAILYSKLNAFIISVITFLAIIIFLFFGFFLSEGASYNNGLKRHQNGTSEINRTILDNIFLYKRRIVEVVLDLVFICIAYYSSYFLRYEGSFPPPIIYLIKNSLVWIILIKMSAFFVFGLYRGVWRYISISDLLTIFKVVSIGSVSSVLFLTFMCRFKDYSRAVFFIDWMILLFLIAGTRIIFRVLGEFLSRMREKGKNVLIFGAGDTGEMVIREIKRNKSLNYNAVGFIDDNPAKIGNRIQGITVLGSRERIKDIAKDYDVEELVIAVSSLNMDTFLDIINICNDCHIPYRKIKGILDKEEKKGLGKE